MSQDLFDLIEKRRRELEASLVAALEKHDAANDAVKAIRAQLDDLPVKKVRRPKKTQPSDVGQEVD